MTADRVTKLLVVVSMAGALLVEAVLAARGWRAVLPLTIAAFFAASLISMMGAELCAAAVLLFAYTFPAFFVVTHGRFEVGFTTIWMAGLLGVIVPRSVGARWTLPPRWKAPLVLWALTIALLWPIVVLREVDFSPVVMDLPHLSITGPPGVPPDVAIVWILNVTLTLGLGILWFEWLCSRFDGAEQRFRVFIIGGLAASWLVATSMGVYQFLFDMAFLNSGRFTYLRRASGTMLDANPFGVIAALGTPVVVAWACVTPQLPRIVVPVVTVVSWLALWASGSRTALATGVIGTLFALGSLYDFTSKQPDFRGRTRALVGAVGALTLVIAVVFISTRAIGPWRRLQAMLPDFSRSSIESVGSELWNRNAYGTHATRMIEDHPSFGIGAGMFHFLVLDYSRSRTGGVALPGDNAQNWYRHQLAEFGLIGSVGWILWVASFGWFVLSRRVLRRSRYAVWPVKGTIVAIAFVSLVGMPTQNTSVTVTFWTLVCWYLLLVDERITLNGAGATNEVTGRTWIAIWTIVAICVGGTAYSARHTLRVPFRAAAFGWPYSYGFFDPEAGPAGQFRWAQKKGVIVLDAPKPWMKLTVSVNQLNVARKPVDVKVWRDTEEVLRTTLRDATPLTQYVRIPDDQKRIVLETWVSRVVRPSDFGVQDPRELGLMVGWDFVDGPAVGATVVGQ